MTDISIITKHFELSEKQNQQFAALPSLYREWNEKINVISRKDIDNLMLHHVLHSLAIAKFIIFKNGISVLDIGTGGGFPGIPLAILFPDVKFTLVDSIGKKINVVKAISQNLGLSNVNAENARAENVSGEFDFVVSRATASMNDLLLWSRGKFKAVSQHHIYNGIICLKGGNLESELAQFQNEISLVAVNQYFEEEFFSQKFVVHLPVF